MYKTFTITITMPMSWYSRNRTTFLTWLSRIKEKLEQTSSEGEVTVDVQETPDPVEMENESNITDLTEVTGFKG